MTVYIITVRRYSKQFLNTVSYIDSVFENELDAWNRIEDLLLNFKRLLESEPNSCDISEIRTDNSLLVRYSNTAGVRYDIQKFVVHPRL